MIYISFLIFFCLLLYLIHNELAILQTQFYELKRYFSYKKNNRLHISLLGSYQPRNAAVVLEAIDRLNESGFNISLDNIRDGLRDAKWSARFEILSKNPRSSRNML